MGSTFDAVDSSPAATPRRAGWIDTVAVVGVCLAAFAFFVRLPLNHDSAWLLDATGRWLDGARLYVDISEVNPPWVFYLTALLTLGTATKAAYLAAVCLTIAAATLWCMRLGGRAMGWAALAAMLFGGLTDFGQREHLALIFVAPYLFADRVGRRESIALGLFAFLGVGLKPHFLLIPAGAVLARALCERSWRPIFTPANWALGAACIAYALAVVAFHPAYFTEIVPLAQFVYVYGSARFGAGHQSVLLIACALAALLTAIYPSPRRMVLAAAMLGALAAYLIQAKWWSYQLVPVAGLALLVGASAGLGGDGRRVQRVAGWCVVAMVLFAVVSRGPYAWRLNSVIPPDARAVTFLSANVSAPYPQTFERGVRHVSRYSAFWPLPGAVAIAEDPSETPARRARARQVLDQTRAVIVSDILAGKPDYIFAQTGKLSYFRGPFDYVAFLKGDPRFEGYDEVGVKGRWRVLKRRPSTVYTALGRLAQ